MPLNLANLDEQTRKLALEETEHDIAGNSLYISPRLTETGRQQYPDLLRNALASGDDNTLAQALRKPGMLRETEERRKRSGGTTIAKVPKTAAETLAEGEFNRLYIRGLCRHALENDIPELVIYRAKEVGNPRPESEARIGRTVSATKLLDDLRSHVGVEPALGVPPGPNSGLSVRLP